MAEEYTKDHLIEDAEDVGGLQIKSPKPKFSPEEIAAAKARAAKFGL